MVILISFDIDGTLEIGDPPGILTMDMVRIVQQKGFLSVLQGGYVACLPTEQVPGQQLTASNADVAVNPAWRQGVA